MSNINQVYYGKIFIKEEYDNMLADYGVIVLGEYNKELGYFEDCLMSKVVLDKLMKLAQDNILLFDGKIVKGLDELNKLINKKKETY